MINNEIKSLRWISFVSKRFASVDRKGRSAVTSFLATLGICVGVMTLIVVISVMNGFQMSFIDSILEISSYHGRVTDLPEEMENDFVKFCTDNTNFLNSFLNDLTNKIITLNKSITTLSLTSIRQKISNFLLNEYKVQGSVFIKLNMTKQKLSEILGVPRPSLSRELINMKDLGIIDYSRDFIKILNKEELENLLTQ